MSGAEVGLSSSGAIYRSLVHKQVKRCGIKTLSFEEDYMPVGEYRLWEEAVNVQFLPASDLLTKRYLAKLRNLLYAPRRTIKPR